MRAYPETQMQRIECVDSHTGGEPTRVVINGAPDLGDGGVKEQLAKLRTEHDWLRRSVILEPRGCDWLVGALLLEPSDPRFEAAIIFFNNTGYLGMCGHGLIGVVSTLAHLGRIQAGECQFETPVGNVSATLHEDGSVSISNVLSYRWKKAVPVNVPEVGMVTGDIAWGGNWFFLSSVDAVDAANMQRLLTHTRRIRAALDDQQIRGKGGGLIDHIEVFGPPSNPDKADSRNFVLCPGGEYDRSPCGTGTSAKLACLAADGRLQPGEVWRQESVIGSVFEGRYAVADGGVLPTITGRAHVTGESSFILQDDDPFQHGIDLTETGGN